MTITDIRPETMDESPSSDVEYPCVVCGKESGPYSGRGRKPKFCDEHKNNRGTGTGTRTPRTTKNDELGLRAAKCLANYHSIAGVGLRMVGLSETQRAIVQANDPFVEQAALALSNDPKLCMQILRSGGTSSIVGLLVAYGMFLSAVSPVAAFEWRANHPKRDTE